MNLSKKKSLASRTLGVGIDRIIFVKSRLEEIKEAITKQDIRDLKESGAISIKDIKGKKRERKNKSRSRGNVRKNVNKRKREYVIITRKLRKFLYEKKKHGKIPKEAIEDIRKKIRNKYFKSKAQLNEYLKDLK